MAGSSSTIHLKDVDSLLKICRTETWGADFPRTARGLLHISSRAVPVENVADGTFYYIGNLNQVTSVLERIQRDLTPNRIDLSVNIDGVSLARSGPSQFWPILAFICDLPFRKVFPIGIFHGISKPSSVDEYLNSFIAEATNLCANGIIFKGKRTPFCVRNFVCDAPARAFILAVKSHSGFFGCSKCTVEGDYVNHVVFLETNCPLRTDQSFRRQLDEDHHVGYSPLLALPINMVKSVPVEPMHLVYLGAVRKLFLQWMFGNVKEVRIRKRDFTQLNNNILRIQNSMPREFARKPRTLKEIKRFKATEFRKLILYTGPIVLKGCVSEPVYANFMVLHVALRILSTKKWYRTRNLYAHRLLLLFVKVCRILYGAQFISYNIHNILHLALDALMFGSLEEFSAFVFESYQKVFKNLIRAPNRPLQQVVKRLLEKEKAERGTLFPSCEPFNVVFQNRRIGRGPLPQNLIPARQYASAKLGDSIYLSTSHPENCIYLNDLSVVVIENFVELLDGCKKIVGRKFNTKIELYTYPVVSSYIEIFKVKDPLSLDCWHMNEIYCKAVIFSLPDHWFATIPKLSEPLNFSSTK